jgi:hypothetical protein
MNQKDADTGFPYPVTDFVAKSKLTFTSLPMVVEWKPESTSAPSSAQINLRTSDLRLDEKGSYSVEFMAVVRDAKGKLVDMVRETKSGNPQGALVWTAKLKPLVNEGSVRFIAVDLISRKTGALSVSFKSDDNKRVLPVRASLGHWRH